jgi:hypothetical protein
MITLRPALNDNNRSRVPRDAAQCKPQLRSKQMSTGIFNSSTTQKAKDAHTNPIVSYSQFTFSSGSLSASTYNAASPVNNPLASLKKGVNRKRTPEELDVAQQTAERYCYLVSQVLILT